MVAPDRVAVNSVGYATARRVPVRPQTMSQPVAPLEVAARRERAAARRWAGSDSLVFPGSGPGALGAARPKPRLIPARSVASLEHRRGQVGLGLERGTQRVPATGQAWSGPSRAAVGAYRLYRRPATWRECA